MVRSCVPLRCWAGEKERDVLAGCIDEGEGYEFLPHRFDSTRGVRPVGRLSRPR